MTKIIKNFKA
jgi:hypothetical protein